MSKPDYRRSVREALCRRVRNQRMDLVATHGIEAVMQAIEDCANRFDSLELEEIGSSDVSCWVSDIEASLKAATEKKT